MSSGEADWMPAWWDLSEPAPRQPLPELLARAAHTDTTKRAIQRVGDLVVEAFLRDEEEGPTTHAHSIVPPGADGSFLLVQGQYDLIMTEAVLTPANRPLLRRDRNVLLDLGFTFHDDVGMGAMAIMLDPHEPEPAWRLAAVVGVALTHAVYRPYFDPWDDSDHGWTLSDIG